MENFSFFIYFFFFVVFCTVSGVDAPDCVHVSLLLPLSFFPLFFQAKLFFKLYPCKITFIRVSKLETFFIGGNDPLR